MNAYCEPCLVPAAPGLPKTTDAIIADEILVPIEPAYCCIIENSEFWSAFLDP